MYRGSIAALLISSHCQGKSRFVLLRIYCFASLQVIQLMPLHGIPKGYLKTRNCRSISTVQTKNLQQAMYSHGTQQSHHCPVKQRNVYKQVASGNNNNNINGAISISIQLSFNSPFDIFGFPLSRVHCTLDRIILTSVYNFLHYN